MLDNIQNSSNSITFNSVSGTLVKSKTDSLFARFHQNSEMARSFFGSDQYFSNSNGYKIVILQVMLSSDDYYLVEYYKEKKEG